MKRLTALTLIMAMILLIAAGCGSNQATPQDAAAASNASAEAGSDVPAAETLESSGDTPASPADSDARSDTSEDSQEEMSEEIPEEPPEKVYATVEYPLEPATLTMWAEIKASVTVDEWNDLIIMDSIAEKSGVTLDVTSVSDSTSSEEFNLMVAAHAECDLLMAPDIYYSGGIEAAYNEDVVIDLTDMLAEHAPDYLRHAEGLNEKSQASIKSGDQYLCIYSLADNYYNIVGCVIRQDWLDDLNLDRPTDMDSFTEVLTAFHNTYSPEYTLFTTDAALTYLSDLFDTYTVGFSNWSFPAYVSDGTVFCPFTTDAYREYLEWFAGMYQEGIVNQDFYNTHPLMIRTASGNNGTGFWYTRCEGIDEWSLFCEDPAILEYCNPQPMAYMDNGDGSFDWGNEMTYVDKQAAYSISANCENPELALEFLNYFFTEEGSQIVNYGVEGYTWERTASGDIAWTELVTNNPEGMSPQTVVNATTGTALLSCLQISERMFSTYSETAQLFLDYCNTNITDEHAFPSAAALTSDQAFEVSDGITSLLTYSSEQILKFMTCSEEINDSTWAAFQQALKDMGIEHILELYQENYTAYAAQFA